MHTTEKSGEPDLDKLIVFFLANKTLHWNLTLGMNQLFFCSPPSLSSYNWLHWASSILLVLRVLLESRFGKNASIKFWTILYWQSAINFNARVHFLFEHTARQISISFLFIPFNKLIFSIFHSKNQFYSLLIQFPFSFSSPGMPN